MKFSELANRCSLKINIAEDFEVKGLTYDSRKVQEGYIFFAIKGFKQDGNKYIGSALSSGAKAVLTEQEPPEGSRNIYRVEAIRKQMALLSGAFYGNPSGKIKLIGVTGTNGKTTVTHLIKAGLEEAGYKAGMMGTIDYHVGGKKITSSLTTPDSIEINMMLKDMVDEGLDYCVMEVSSIALVLDRVFGLKYDTAVFTNLSSEHLDLHETMENYFAAKKILFDNLDEKSSAVTNKDDFYGAAIVNDTKAQKIFYSINNDSAVMAQSYKLNMDGSEFRVHLSEGSYDVRTNLTGKFNIYNILAAISALRCSGAAMDIILKAMQNVQPVSGRFNRIKLPNGAYAIVDYSHTSDSLKNAIEAAIEIINEQEKRGRIITIFGCGGDRDKTKRPVMGNVATQLSDWTIITSDNPRSEEPMAIIDEILEGVETKGNYEIEPDREKAIKRGIEVSEEGDLILICGKGHETYQEIKGVKSHFDDKEMVEKYSALANKHL
jgi:UDP-N-acetylmuramoyl-L-alanyl-D-glutamate--2,6-diaminopimelate ligase